ncbi:polysaccharide deacetylase family protein [Paenibacillus sp. L3-i20]|uniref:polysaccharide deacetylase family protein n=1 Tax=Paenibacillus sp. L3-i20 TaxID=2905833 RepID=UPI001EDF6EC6|nr:polysaccharide deacetylase family protein [Paenibacillus sp. L3-i20]GKU79573.1 hypothetical protein L3i20_v239700 [Paenibacillus sp. L3-i20]
MQKLKISTLIVLLAVQLTGCSSTTTDWPLNGESKAATTQTLNPTNKQVMAIETSLQPSPTPKATTKVDPTTEPLYKMNKVFRFEPIAESTTKKAVLLTFDDGPNDEKTLTSILDTLDKYQAKAIFFVNGYQVKQHPELLKLIHEREQTIGNHSYDHISLRKENKDVVEKQLASVQTEVKQLTGQKPRFFRPPYGEGSNVVKEIAKNHGMLYMTWSNGSLDWDKSAKNKPDIVIKNVMEQLHPGANILMHELKWTAEALDPLLSKIEEEGYSFINPETIEVKY